MQYEIELVKGKWLWLKDIWINRLYAWFNWPRPLWIKLTSSLQQGYKLMVGETELNCFIGDSTQPIRFNAEWLPLFQLVIEIPWMTIWALTQYNLKLTLE